MLALDGGGTPGVEGLVAQRPEPFEALLDGVRDRSDRRRRGFSADLVFLGGHTAAGYRRDGHEPPRRDWGPVTRTPPTPVTATCQRWGRVMPAEPTRDRPLAGVVERHVAQAPEQDGDQGGPGGEDGSHRAGIGGPEVDGLEVRVAQRRHGAGDGEAHDGEQHRTDREEGDDEPIGSKGVEASRDAAGPPLRDEHRTDRRGPPDRDQEGADDVARPVPTRSDGGRTDRGGIHGAGHGRGSTPPARDDEEQGERERERDGGVPARDARDRKRVGVQELGSGEDVLEGLGGGERPDDQGAGTERESHPGASDGDRDDRPADELQREDVDGAQDVVGGLLDPRVLGPTEEGVVVEVLPEAGVDRKSVQDDQGDDAHPSQDEQPGDASARRVVGRGVDGTSLAADPTWDAVSATGVGCLPASRYSWTSSIRVPNADLGCKKATVVPRLPGRGTSSITRCPSARTRASAAAQSCTR